MLYKSDPSVAEGSLKKSHPFLSPVYFTHAETYNWIRYPDSHRYYSLMASKTHHHLILLCPGGEQLLSDQLQEDMRTVFHSALIFLDATVCSFSIVNPPSSHWKSTTGSVCCYNPYQKHIPHVAEPGSNA